ISLNRSGFFDMSLSGDPAGRMAELMARLLPQLRVESLLADRQTRGSLAWWLYDLPLWLRAAWQTLEMAILATTLGAALAVLASFLCARNLMPWAPVRFAV